MWLIRTASTIFQILELILICSFVFFIMSSGPLFKLFIVLIIAIQFVWIIRISNSSWWALILFLVYISGILIAFAYFTAFSAKERFFLDFKLRLGIAILILIINKHSLIFSHQEAGDTLVINNRILFILLGLFLLYILILRCIICLRRKYLYGHL